MRWWLPNDEDYPPIIRSIRNFVEERTSKAKNLPAEDLRDMKAIFSSMKLDDGKSSVPPSSKSGSTSGVAVATSHESYMAHDNIHATMDPESGAYTLGFDDGSRF